MFEGISYLGSTFLPSSTTHQNSYEGWQLQAIPIESNLRSSQTEVSSALKVVMVISPTSYSESLNGSPRMMSKASS